MNTFIDFTHIWWPVAADFCIQSTLLLGFVIIVVSFLRKTSSARRHALLLAGMLAIPVLLLAATFGSVHWRISGPEKTSIGKTTILEPVSLQRESKITTGTPVSLVPMGKAESIATSDAENDSIINWPFLGLMAWLSGTFLCLVRLMVGWLSLQFATRRLRSPESSVVTEQFNAVLRHHSSLEGVRLLQGGMASMPMTFGVLRPTIVLPEDAENWETERRRRVILHELAHAARKDCLTNTLALISGCLLWFHPFTWICWRLLRREQESAADDWALQQSVDPEAYADDLVAIVRDCPNRIPGVGLAFAINMASGVASLKKRLDSLLDDRRDRSQCGRRIVLACLPIALISTIGLGGLAACREGGSEFEDDVQETRRFALSPTQSDRLTVKEDRYDPFSDRETYPNFLLQESLKHVAERIKDLNLKTPVANISLPDKNTLVVTANRSSLAQFEEWLKTLDGSHDVFVGIEVRVFKAPADTDFDAVLNLDGNTPVASGSIAGILDDEAGRKLFQSLKANPSLQLVQVPSLTTRSGERATFEHVREVIYPVEYDPPKISAASDSKDDKMKAEAELIRLEALGALSGARLIEEAEDLGIQNTIIKTMYPRFLELKTELASLERTGIGEENPQYQAIKAEEDETARQLDRGVMAAKRAMNTKLEMLRTSIAADREKKSQNNSIIPATPRSFETRNAGTMFEFMPQVLADNRIDFFFNLDHVRLLGFMNYGTPLGSADSEDGVVQNSNNILMPVFESSKCSSTSTIDSGSWLVVAGLGNEETSGASTLGGASGLKLEQRSDGERFQFIILIHVTVDEAA